MEYMTVKEASELWGYSTTRIALFCREGKIKCKRGRSNGINCVWEVYRNQTPPRGLVRNQNMKMKNKYTHEENVTKIFLNDTKGKEHVVIIDREDFEKVSSHTWCANIVNNKIYAVTRISGKENRRMHNLILQRGTNKSQQTIFKNSNTLDLRKENLAIDTISLTRHTSTKKSNSNTSGIRGVSWDKRERKWQAQITVNHKTYKIGGFEKKEDATKARKDLERKFNLDKYKLKG